MKRLIVTLLVSGVLFGTIWVLAAGLPPIDGTVENRVAESSSDCIIDGTVENRVAESSSDCIIDGDEPSTGGRVPDFSLYGSP